MNKIAIAFGSMAKVGRAKVAKRQLDGLLAQVSPGYRQFTAANKNMNFAQRIPLPTKTKIGSDVLEENERCLFDSSIFATKSTSLADYD